MQWSGWMLLIGLVLLSTTSPASPSNASPRELKALRAALKKQQRLKEQRSSSASGINSKGVGGTGTAGSSSIGGSGEYVPDAGPWASSSMDGGKEPSCEQLREMWRQSKRHSRAAEATNEIPQYADPFARAAALHYGRQRQQQQLGFSGAEPTLRPRQERRPVVYGRLHSSPSSLDGQEVVDRPPRPFDVLRKLSRTESADGGSASSDGQNSGARSGVVLYGEEDRSPFPKSPAKGSLQHLRELVREEQGGGGQLPSGVKGSFQQLRDIVREENREGRLSSSSSGGRSSDWSDADVGRVVTSPSDHSSSGVGGSKYSLFAMQGDAPYESPSSSLSAYQQQHSSSASSNNRRPASNNNNNYNRLSSFGKSHHRNHNINRQQMSDLLASDPTAAAAASSAAVMASRRPFQLRDPPRPKIGSSRLVGSSQRAANNNRWSSSSSSGGSPDSSNDDDVGVVRGYVAGGGRTNANPFYSSPPAKPSRRSSALADEEEEDDCGDFGEESDPFCRVNSDCRCASLALGVQQRCQRGRCVPMSNRNGQQKQKRQQRNQHQKRKSSTSLRRRRLEDDQVDDDEWRTSDRDVESRLEQLLQEEQQQQQSEDEEESSADESRSSSRLSGRKADAIRDIIDALQQIDQQQESTD